MEAALTVTALWLLFGGLHVGLATRRIRAVLVGRLGEGGFMALFSAVAVASFTLLVRYYARHRFDGLPGPALGAVAACRWPLMAGVVAGVALIACSVVTYARGPFFGLLPVGTPRGLERVTRHPMFAGIAILAGAHALLAAQLVGTAFFAGFAALALLGAWHQDRKLLQLRGPAYGEYLAASSTLPFAAIAAGRQQLVWRELPLGTLAAGVGVAWLLRSVHGAIFAHDGAWVVVAVIAAGTFLQLQAWLHARRVRAAAEPAEDDFRRRALACCGATLLAYVGLVHETVGATLYPYGPAAFGGALGWHAAGLGLIAVGLLLLAGSLGLVRLPVAPLAAVTGTAGAGVAVMEAAQHGGLHFFALTMVVASALVVVSGRSGAARRSPAGGRLAVR